MIYYQENLLIIRTWKYGDESFLAHHANNYNIWKFVMDLFPHPYTYDDAKCWVEKNAAMNPPLNFALVYDGEPIGNIGLIPCNDIYIRNMNLGYWISEAYWGKGITTVAVKWLVSHAFANFEIKRLAASVFSNNKNSMRVLLKSGFKSEAVLKDAIFKNNEFLDEHIFSVIK